MAGEDQFAMMDKLESTLNLLLSKNDNNQLKTNWVLVRTGTAANCNLTKGRNQIDYTLLIRTRSNKAYLHWLKERVLAKCLQFTDV